MVATRFGGVGADPAGWPVGVLSAADRERFGRYAEALAFFRGEQWLGKGRRGETRLTVNYARALVRKTAAYVFPAPVGFSVPVPEGRSNGVGERAREPGGARGPDGERERERRKGWDRERDHDRGRDRDQGQDQDQDQAQDTGQRRHRVRVAVGEAFANRAERTLAEAIAELDLGRLDAELCVDGAVLGDAAVKVRWDAAAGRPAVAPVDPATLAVESASDDPRRVVRVTQVYSVAPEALAELGLAADGWRLAGAIPPPAVNRQPSAAPQVVAVAETWTAERWRVEVAGQVARDGANPYGWIPYVVLPNNPRPHAFWGESDLVDLFDVCRELNARLSILSRLLDVSGAPIAVLENVDGAEGIAVGPGATWELPEGARAYLLDLLSGGGVGLHIQYVDLLYRAMHDLSETPRTAFGDAGRDLSGAALEVEIQPLVQKVGRKRRGWEAFYHARNARLLDLLERFGGEPLGGLRRTEAIWPSPLPSDLDGEVRNAASLVAGGIHSRRTAAAALGEEDPEREWARVLEEMAALRAVES